MNLRRLHRIDHASRGAVLVEFALVAFALTFLLASIVEMGRVVFTAQVLQDVARVAARELSLVPLPPDATFEDALADPRVRAEIFDARALVIDLDAVPDLDAYFATLPILNRMLRPLMIVEERNDGLGRLLRYPGALLRDRDDPSVLTVGIPRVVARSDGEEVIEWLPILEEVRVDPNDPSTGAFALTATDPSRGLVAVRVNYPFQASALSGFRRSPAGPYEPNAANRIQAGNVVVAPSSRPAPGILVGDDGSVGPHAGAYGLGRQFAFVETVRPYRKLISSQGVYRREVFDFP